MELQSSVDSNASILIVDDNDAICRLLASTLRGEAGRVETASTAAEARQKLKRHAYDLVITDISMPDEDGLSLMQWAKDERSRASWMVLTGHASVDVAVRALQLGAVDFINKPLDSMVALRNTVGNVMAHRRLVRERDRLNAELAQRNEQLQVHVEQLEAAIQLLSEQSDTIRADLRRAAFIQQALLPRTSPRLDNLCVNALYRPSENVGGDLYDIVKLDDRHLVLIVADAAGHGLSAAMLAVLFRNRLPLVDAETGAPTRPCEALRTVNRSLCESLAAPALFITAAYVLIDLETRILSVASAGHPPLLLRHHDTSLERILHTGPALGLYEDAIFVEQDLELVKGDRLLLYTDGLYDRIDLEGTTPEQAVEGALRGFDVSGAVLLRDLFDGAGNVAGQEDDVTLVVVDVVRGSSTVDNGTLIAVPAPSVTGSERLDILVGDEERHITLCIRGRADWSQSAAFHERCIGAIESTQPILVDLTLCDHLDSTFLGTIHELAVHADRADVEFRLQGVMPPVVHLFQELGMSAVMDHIVQPIVPLPRQMAPLRGGAEDLHAKAVRLLRAHEGLAGLNEKNFREFDPLVEMLRNEVTGSCAD